MNLNIQLFGGRGASSGGSRRRGAGSGFFGEEKGGYKASNGTARYFAGDKVTRRDYKGEPQQYTVTDTRNGKLELYNGNETLRLSNSVGVNLVSRGRAGETTLARERMTVLRAANERITINGRKIAAFNEAPRGYVKTNGATTAPKGYSWYSNNKSLFGDERINILVKNKKRK